MYHGPVYIGPVRRLAVAVAFIHATVLAGTVEIVRRRRRRRASEDVVVAAAEDARSERALSHSLALERAMLQSIICIYNMPIQQATYINTALER